MNGIPNIEIGPDLDILNASLRISVNKQAQNVQSEFKTPIKDNSIEVEELRKMILTMVK